MASTARRKPVEEAGVLSEDTVEQEFGGDYSEASLEVIRALGPKKGAPFAEVDPAEQAAARPPSQAECDAAKAQLEEYKREVDALKNYRPSERERAAIDARRALVLEATPEELTWLKMREYYSAQRAAAAAAAAANGAASTSTAGAADASAAAGDDVVALRAGMLRVAMEALGSATETDELETRAASHLAASSAGRQSGRGGAGAAAPAEASAAALAAAADAAVAAGMAGSSSRYREDYLEEERLTRQVARQRGQRSQAFALSLAAAVGVSVARWWLRRGRGSAGAGAGGSSGGPSRSRSTQLMQ